jgi:O-antigen/teichoic acid export membrane protein
MTYSAGRWTTASALLRSGLQVLQIAVLARLLLPADFGLMAIASALLALAMLFADLGLSRALIHFEQPSAEVLSTLYWANICISVLLMLVCIGVAPLFAIMYQDDALTTVLIVSSLVFPFSAIGQQFRVLAEKNLRFATLAVVETLAAVIGFSAAIAVALMGGGVYALVAGFLTTSLSSSVLAWWRLSDHRIPRFELRISESRPFFRFGIYLIGENAANTLRMHADVFIGGLVTNPTAMGFYALPRDLSLRIANTIVNPVITRIGFPVMAKLQHDRAALKRVYLQTMRMTSSINFPIYVALAIFSEEAVWILFGPQWESAANFLRIFAIWGLIRSVGNPIGSLLHAAGQVRRGLFWNLVLLGTVPPILLLGAQLGGIEGLAVAMLLTQIAIFFPAWRLMVFPICGARLAEYLATMLPPLWISLGAGALAFSVASFSNHELLRLVLGLGTGFVAYLVLSLLGNRQWVLAVMEFLKLRGPAPNTKQHQAD